MNKRMSVTLDAEDEQALAAFVDPGTIERAALAAWAVDRGIDPGRLGSDAAVIRALLRAGVHSLSERALDLGYAAIAIEANEEDGRETHEARRRYLARTERQ